MSDPFGDLDDTLDDPDGGGAGETDSSEATGETADTPAAGSDDGTDTGSVETGTADGAGSSPAFPFAEADQTAVYPRGETWAAFEDFLDFEVRRQLREAGVRDDTKRELHEAALQVIQNHPEAVADQFLANRRE
ncbi:MAG: hypothetical protein J07HB67_00229 [halophilic archaeon J07HB67]|nr:MAG: hypothetical protein J07HB67_00229 [halophilic archaeon J07HB67]